MQLCNLGPSLSTMAEESKEFENLLQCSCVALGLGECLSVAHLEESPIRIGIISYPEELKRHVIAFHYNTIVIII